MGSTIEVKSARLKLEQALVVYCGIWEGYGAGSAPLAVILLVTLLYKLLTNPSYFKQSLYLGQVAIESRGFFGMVASRHDSPHKP